MAIEHRNALPTGYELEGYRIEGVLGHGGFGITYRATDLANERQVAMKEYLPAGFATRDPAVFSVHPTGPEDAEDFNWGLQRFEQEALTLAAFNHSNIVAVHRYFEANSTAYLVMEYERGDSLASILARDGPLPEDEVREFLYPLMNGLSRVHKAGFLHRDIKPENVYIRTDGTPVLLDFGSARHAVGARSQSLTSIVSGGYAPFEQYIADGHQSPASDIYALGATLYRTITGNKPPEATARITDDPFVPSRAATKKGYSPELLAAVDAALRVHERDRPQNIEEFADILEGRSAPRAMVDPAADDDVTVPPNAVGHAGAQSVAKSGGKGFPTRLVLIAVAAIVLASAGGGAYYILQKNAEAARLAEERRKAEARRTAEELRQRQAEEQRRKAEEARRRAEEEAGRRGGGSTAAFKPGINVVSFQVHNACRYPIRVIVHVKTTDEKWIFTNWIQINPKGRSRLFLTKNRHVYYTGVSLNGRRSFNASNGKNPKRRLNVRGTIHTFGHINTGPKWIRWVQRLC
ncbi:MAG TPA: protein kinase [Alphaproteobacteria bacterium]|nr:protein kinase [Alphaproteobacteria bacterium]